MDFLGLRNLTILDDAVKNIKLNHDLDLDLLATVRDRWQFYRDRRPDAYGPLVSP